VNITRPTKRGCWLLKRDRKVDERNLWSRVSEFVDVNSGAEPSKIPLQPPLAGDSGWIDSPRQH